MKEIRKEQIIQLKEHDLNRGHNRSQTPVYPVTTVEAILGSDQLGGVTKVESLPEEGEVGKIYFDTTTSKYYVYNASTEKFEDIQHCNIVTTQVLPTFPQTGIIYHLQDRLHGTDYYKVYDGDTWHTLAYSEVPIVVPRLTWDGDTGVGNAPALVDTYYLLEDNIYYIIGSSNSIKISIPNPGASFAKQYFGRFTAAVDNMPFTISTVGVYFADNNPSIEANHMYEFNILHNVCLLTDITYTEPSSQGGR